MPTNFIPADPFFPCALNHSAPRARIAVANVNVSTLLIDRRLVPKTVGPGEGRLVARLGALAFDGLEQRALFAADITAGADEDLEIETQFAAQDVFRPATLRGSSGQSLPAEFPWVLRIRAGYREFRCVRSGHQARR